MGHGKNVQVRERVTNLVNITAGLINGRRVLAYEGVYHQRLLLFAVLAAKVGGGNSLMLLGALGGNFIALAAPFVTLSG